MFPANSLIPIHDENPTSRFSVFTAVIIALNIVVFLATPGFGATNASATFFYQWGVVPWEITHGETLREGGQQCLVQCVQNKNIWLSLLTSMFIHGSLFHVGGNMLFLWVFGNNIEDAMTRTRYIVFYLLTGLAAGWAHILVNPESTIPTVGASGAVAGLLGAYLVLFPRATVISILPLIVFFTTVRLPAMAVIGIWFLSQFFIAAAQQVGGPGVAWMAHVGGFIAGAALILLFRPRRRPPPSVGWA